MEDLSLNCSHCEMKFNPENEKSLMVHPQCENEPVKDNSSKILETKQNVLGDDDEDLKGKDLSYRILIVAEFFDKIAQEELKYKKETGRLDEEWEDTQKDICLKQNKQKFVKEEKKSQAMSIAFSILCLVLAGVCFALVFVLSWGPKYHILLPLMITFIFLAIISFYSDKSNEIRILTRNKRIEKIYHTPVFQQQLQQSIEKQNYDLKKQKIENNYNVYKETKKELMSKIITETKVPSFYLNRADILEMVNNVCDKRTKTLNDLVILNQGEFDLKRFEKKHDECMLQLKQECINEKTKKKNCKLEQIRQDILNLEYKKSEE